MIRRWSHINSININSLDFFFFEKQRKISIFKNSVNFKKFKYKYSKFKRKSNLRLKHGSSFLIYTNVFKTWSADYIFNKHSIKNQYLINIFPNNSFFYNFNFIKNKNETATSSINYVFSTWSKKSYFYYFFKNHTNTFPYFKNNNIAFVWYLKNLPSNPTIALTYTQQDSTLYPYNIQNSIDYKKKFNFLNFFLYTNVLIFSKIIQYYKILTILVYFKNI